MRPIRLEIRENTLALSDFNPFARQLQHEGFDALRVAELASIRQFVAQEALRLQGRVLDYGAGKPGTCRKPQPYRELIYGDYVPFDKGDTMPMGTFDAILCTQVLQYIFEPNNLLAMFHAILRPGGALVMTYPTAWPEVDDGDLRRDTAAGMEWMLTAAGFTIAKHERRAELFIPPNTFALGYGVVATR